MRMEEQQWRNSMHFVLKELVADPLPQFPLQLQILAAAGPAWHDGSDLSYQPIKKSNHNISHAGIWKR